MLLRIKEKISTNKQKGDAAELQALRYLQAQHLRLLQRNYRTPGRGGGEIDLIMQTPDGTTVFIEVRQRNTTQHGGAAASVIQAKQGRIIFAARHYLSRLGDAPPCRFDVLVLEPQGIQWIQAAFDVPT